MKITVSVGDSIELTLKDPSVEGAVQAATLSYNALTQVGFSPLKMALAFECVAASKKLELTSG